MTFDKRPSTRTLQTSAERETFGAAAVYMSRWNDEPQPEEQFLDQLPAARKNISHRLVRGLLRGRPDGLPSHTLLSTRSPTITSDAHTALQNRDGEDLLRRIRPLPETARFVALLPFSNSETILAAPIEAIRGYDRFQLVGPFTLLTSTRTVRNPHPVDIISLLEEEGITSKRQAEQIIGEIAESVANLAFARLSSTNTDTGSLPNVQNILEISEDLPGSDPASSLERLAIEGHPFHPSAKIRRGMTPAESLLYAPEFTDKIGVRFVAVETEYTLQTQTNATLTELLYDHFPGLKAAVERAIPTDRYQEDYAVIPIHPWQYYHVIPDRYAAQIDQDRIVPLPEYTWSATPLLNLRTVVPYTDDHQTEPLPHLKLAIDVQLTNATRTVSPQAVSNGPRMTGLLNTILGRESFENLGILSEAAATCYHAPGGPHPDGEEYDNARNLSGLIRENPYSHPLVPDDGIPVAVGSLLAKSPATDQPLVCDILDQFKAARDAGTGETAAKAFFESYVDTVVPEQLHLLSKYGIALESHPQNSYVVFSDGYPAATLVRDLGGIRVFGERLAQHDLDFVPYPNSDLEAYGERDLYNKLYYALFQNQFAELIVTLVEHAVLDESDCWDYIRTCCLETFETLRSKSDIPNEWVNQDESVLFEDPTNHKALTVMRLQGKSHKYVTSQISNPLTR